MKKLICIAALAALVSCSKGPSFTMVTTTEDNPWVETTEYVETAEGTAAGLTVDLQDVRQTVVGFGTCFSELSHRALSKLSKEDYESVISELFTPRAGANFTLQYH